MDNKSANAASLRQLSMRKRVKEDLLTRLFGWANIISALGLMIGLTGVITFVRFHNLFSKLMLILGLSLFCFGFALKIIEVLLKIIGVRS